MNTVEITARRKLKKDSLPQMVMDCIYQELLEGKLKPGDLLPSEADLSEKLAVGKSSIREAIKMLNVIGIVESVQGEGTFIKTDVDDTVINPLTYQLVILQGTDEQILELRYWLEPSYTLLAMTKASEEDIARIKNTVVEFEKKIASNTQTAMDDLAFHEAILDATHNPYIIRIGKTMLHLFEASIQKSMNTIPNTALEDHKRILDAFLKKDRDALNEAVTKSFDGWKQMLNHLYDNE